MGQYSAARPEKCGGDLPSLTRAVEPVVTVGSEEGSYRKPVLLLRTATCCQHSGLFSILQVQVKDLDWGLDALLTSKQNTKHKNLSLQLISKNLLGSKGPRKRILIPEIAKIHSGRLGILEPHCGSASGHSLYFCPPVTDERSNGAGKRKPGHSQKWEERKLRLQFLLNGAQEGGSAWELLTLEPCRTGGSSCSQELTAGLGSGADLAPGSVCRMAERQNEEGPEHTGNSPTGCLSLG